MNSFYKLVYCCFIETNEKVNYIDTNRPSVRRTMAHNMSDRPNNPIFIRTAATLYYGDDFDCYGVEWDGEILTLCSIYDIEFTLWNKYGLY